MLRAGNERIWKSGNGISCSMLLILVFLLFYGCSPPEDYYSQVLEMEEQGEQTRQETGRSPGEVVVPVANTDPIKVARTSQAVSDEPQEQTEEIPVTEQAEEVQERPPQREIVQESPPPESTQKPSAVKSGVIKDALSAANLGVSVRTVESVNGRLSGGKNSVRVYFTPGSVDVMDDRFGAICAVVYYLNSETNTIDVVAGIAEDEQSNLLAILQSSIGDITEWMTDQITRAEWHSRVTKKIL